MLTCTFAGHAEIYAHISDKFTETIERCLRDTDEAIFYVGGRGEFDAMAASAVRAAKSRYRGKSILLYLVEPYMSSQIKP